MAWRRPVISLAMLAALVVAPSSVSAAPPAILLDATAAPSAGTISTPFALSVRYDGSAGNPAQAVTATVASKVVPLLLVAGSAADGVWSAATLLPAGVWNVTFQASAATAPSSVMAGPLTVLVPPTPAPTPGPTPPTQDSQPSFVVGEPFEQEPTPAPAPAYSNKPSTGRTPAGRVSVAPSPSEVVAAPAPVEPALARGDRPVKSPRRSGSAGPSSSPAAVGPVGASGLPTERRETRPPRDGMLDLVLLIGGFGVASVAILGVAWIVLAGRRDRAAALSASGFDDPAITAIPTVEQRALRRARLRQTDDPILAALGLPDEPPAVVTPVAKTRRRSSSRRRRARN